MTQRRLARRLEKAQLGNLGDRAAYNGLMRSVIPQHKKQSFF
jgi:hypothetical protein